MLCRLPAAALKKAGARGARAPTLAGTRTASVCVVQFHAESCVAEIVVRNRSDLSPRRRHPIQLSRCVELCVYNGNDRQEIVQAFVNSRATAASLTLFTAGSIAWYTHLYGMLPFIGEVKANSPAEEGLHPAAYPWSHNGLLDSFDHARLAPSPGRSSSSR
jgi:hypothetical protein